MERRNGARLLCAAALCALLPVAAAGQIPNCIPSCAPDDARFLAITGGGVGLDTLTDTTLELQVRSPGGSFEIAFFDGESRGPLNSPPGLWDINDGAGQLTFELIADPAGDGSGTTQVDSFNGETMADNDWTAFPVVNDAAAWSGSEYVYLLRAELSGVVGAVRSAFKVRTDGDVSIEVFGQPFSFVAAMPVPEYGIVYPGCEGVPLTSCLGTLSNTTYDGDFAFFLTARQAQQELLIWDGDLDRGNYDGTQLDTDDPNTANDLSGLPPWACVDPNQACSASNPKLPNVEFEGVAMGAMGSPSTGSPPDDADPTLGGGVSAIFVRTGAVSYEVWAPDGRLLATNDNPSGNREWELFRVAVGGYQCDPLVPDEMCDDMVVDELPAGIYEVRVKDLDIENLNAFRFSLPVGPEPSCDNGPDPDDADSDSDSDSDDDGDSDSDSDREVNRPTGLTFIYTGDPCGSDEANNNLQGGQPGTTGDYECSGPLDGDEQVNLVVIKKPDRFEVFSEPEVFPIALDPGDKVTLLALTKNKKLFSQIKVQLQDAGGMVLQEIRLHTSCSQPLEPGDQFGSLKLFRFHFLF